MTTVFTYEAYRKGDPIHKFEDLGGAFRFCRGNPGYRFRRLRPRNRKLILEGMLREKNLGHLHVWYRHKRPLGWMINETLDGDCYQRLGYSFSQAVDMLRGDTVDFMFGAKERKSEAS